MRFFLTVVVVFVVCFAGFYFFGKSAGDDDGGVQSAGVSASAAPDGPRVAGSEVTLKEEQTPGKIIWNHQKELSGLGSPIVIADARMLPLDRQEVPSERDGQLLIIGTEVAPGDQVPPDRLFSATVGRFEFWDGKVYRIWHESDPAPMAKYVRLRRERKEYKRLEVGDEVKAGQTVALVDPILALGEVDIKIAALDAAESDARASKKTKEEAERRVAAMEESMRRVPGSVSKDDYQGAILTAKRYTEEEIAKNCAVVKTQQELIQAQTILTKYEIHATISGTIKVIYKNRGDAVKGDRAADPILQLQSRERLRVEGLMDVQESDRVKPKVTEALIEPTQPIHPKLQIEGHLGECTCVAVSRDPGRVILSGGEDRNLYAWNASTGQMLWAMKHNNAVRSLACTGANSKRSLALAGYADGSARLIDLDKLEAFARGTTKEQPEPILLKGKHRGAVHCVAFSPDGTVCATGGEDRKIYLWDVRDGEHQGERLYELPAIHRAPVTSLQFTPLKQLVSAGHDKQLVVWSVEPGKPPVHVTTFDHRSGDVTRLGVSPDGKQVLFDQGKEIRLLSIDSHQPEGILRNASGAANFSTIALFDPDGLTVLTNGGAEGRLQLWRTPTRSSASAAELRQLVWPRGSATSAAFSTDSSLCVTGMQDGHVLVWPMPERKRDEPSSRPELVETPIRARIKDVEKFIDSSNRQVRVWVELENKENRLVPGGTATMVVLPDLAR
jgi:WD40 repeat protein